MTDQCFIHNLPDDSTQNKLLWISIISGFIAPPLVFLFLKKYKFAFLSFLLIILSLILAKIYASTNNWSLPLWLFPPQIIIHLATAYYLYRVCVFNKETFNHMRIGVLTSLVSISLAFTYSIFAQLLFSKYAIASVSMNPTLIQGDEVITQQVSQDSSEVFLKLLPLKSLTYGDLVIFKHPKEEEIHVKRIIAKAGDKVTFNGNTLLINDQSIKRKLIQSIKPAPTFRWLENQLYYEQNNGKTYKISITGDETSISGNITIPEGHFFVLGDNRNQSIDSRFWGALPKENILAKPLFIWWSAQPGIKPLIRWKRIASWLN